MKPLDAIRCTHSGCPCECFAPGKQSLRHCDTCSHGWVAHALDKLGTSHIMNLGLQVEVVQPNIVFDIASLMLYGAHATPVRLKILLDRLFSVLQHEEVLQVLHGFGWTYEDYARGYILQDSSGRVLDKWCVATREEEMVVLQQFLRFGETKAIAQEIILQDTKDRHDVLVKQSSRESDIKKFIERSNMSMQNYIKSYESTRQLFGSRAIPFIPPNTRLLTSPSYSPTRSESRTITVPQTTTTSATPVVTPPINRLQILQPFDARKEQLSPAVNLNQAVNLSASNLEKVSLSRSPACDSPKNLSTASSTPVSSAATSPALPRQQPQQPRLEDQRPQTGNDEVDGSVNYGSSSEDDEEALDFSSRENPDSPSDPNRKNKQHMRKSNNPIKRQWTPSANFGSTLIGPNGKKRVLCTACNKTFCDKGALKIHYSAVHLKEMHKCSVEGCNMMFSSRRSRNRHSANPNPKLHMPQKRKEELEEAEKKEMAAPSIVNGVSLVPTASPVHTLPSSTSQTPPAVTKAPINLPILEAPRIVRTDPNFFIEMSAQFPFLPPPEKKVKLESGDAPTDLSKMGHVQLQLPTVTNVNLDAKKKEDEEEPCDLSSKKFDVGESKLEIDLEAPSSDSQGDKGDDEPAGEDEGIKNGSVAKGGNRRKSAAPTRCAVNTDTPHNGDDNSDDKDPQSKTFPSITASRDRTVSTTLYVNASNQSTANGTNSNQADLNGSHRSINEGQTVDVNVDPDVIDGQAVTITLDKAYLNSAEAKNFPKIASLLCPNGIESASNNENSGEGEDGDDDDNEDEEGDDVEDGHREDIVLEEMKEMIVVEGETEDVSGGESRDEHDSVQSNDSLIDCPAEYADKENPLKCAACGKVFQNSFTVKIHYQNVHLKVMHECTVEGCAASFPSKRSRDRHSANLNLHRRLLAGESNGEEEMDAAMKGNILAKLYGHDLVANPQQTSNNTLSISLEDVVPVTNQGARSNGNNNNSNNNNNNNNNIINTNNNNNNNELKLGEREIRVFTTKPTPLTNGHGELGLKMTLQKLAGRVSKAGSAGSDAVSEESEGEDETKEGTDGFLASYPGSLVIQEHSGQEGTSQEESPPNDGRKLLPRRIRSRHKTRNVLPSGKASV